MNPLDGNPKSFDEILKYIVYSCRENNSPIAESLIAYILKIMYNPQKRDFFFGKSEYLSGEEAKYVVNEVMQLLQSKKDGVLETLMLQIKFELSYIEEEAKARSFKSFFESEVNSIMDEIKKYVPNNKKDYDTISIYKKIFNFLLVKTREYTQESFDSFGNEENIAQNSLVIEKEIYSAFDNVLPKSGLPPFIALTANDKVAQLNELSSIVFGIRLLNKELGKGGVGLMSLSEIRNKHSRKLFEEINEKHNLIAEICQKYSDVYEAVDFSLVVEDQEHRELEKLRKFIIFYHQINTFLTILKSDLNASHATVETLSINYSKEIQYLLDLVERKSALSKEQVYPRFESLTGIYSKFQEQFFVLNIRGNIYNQLLQFLNNCSIPTKEFDVKELGHFSKYLGTNKKNGTMESNIEAGLYQNGVTVILPHSTADFMDIKLEFQGFCIVTLVTKEGLLVNGKPNIVARYKEKYLVFYNNSAVQEFLYDPEKYIREVDEYIKKHSYLINLLSLTEDYPNASLADLFKTSDSQSSKYKSSSLTVDASIQTVDHPELETINPDLVGKFKFDRDYVWNEWELKIQALQLADIMKKKTQSSQTNLSHFRREKETQIYKLQDSGINTMVSKGTNLSIPRNYISGLRHYDNSYLNNNTNNHNG